MARKTPTYIKNSGFRCTKNGAGNTKNNKKKKGSVAPKHQKMTKMWAPSQKRWRGTQRNLHAKIHPAPSPPPTQIIKCINFNKKSIEHFVAFWGGGTLKTWAFFQISPNFINTFVTDFVEISRKFRRFCFSPTPEKGTHGRCASCSPASAHCARLACASCSAAILRAPPQELCQLLSSCCSTDRRALCTAPINLHSRATARTWLCMSVW